MDGVLRDLETSGLSDKEKALFRFVGRVNGESPQIGPPDMAELHAAGWDDEAIYDAVTVCSLFNFFNRWIDATGVPAMSGEAHRTAGRRMAQAGYIRTILTAATQSTTHSPR